jgi:hypothetical protein
MEDPVFAFFDLVFQDLILAPTRPALQEKIVIDSGGLWR